MLPSLSLTELAPELTADVRNASQTLLPVSDEIEGVTMEFVDELDPDTIPISQLEKLLIEMEGMKTTHLGYIYIFPSAQCTNKPVQTDTTQSGKVTHVHEFKQKTTTQHQANLLEGDASLLSDTSDTNQLTETSRNYVQSASTTSVEASKDVYDNNNKTSGAGSLRTLVSAETQTDPMQPPLESYVHPPQFEEQKLRKPLDTDTYDISGNDNTTVSPMGSIDKPLTKHSDVSMDEDVQLFSSIGVDDDYDESDNDSFESTNEESKDTAATKKQLGEGTEQCNQPFDQTDEGTIVLNQRKVSSKISATTKTTIFADTDQARRDRDKDSDPSRDNKGNKISAEGPLVKEPSFMPKQGIVSQTEVISVDEKSIQSYQNVNQGNQTDEIKMSEKSSEMEQLKSKPSQTDVIVTSKQETQSPVTTHTLSQTEVISNEDRHFQTERLPLGDGDSQTQSFTFKSRDTQTDDVPIDSKYSTTKIATGNRRSQTEVFSAIDVDSQTESVSQGNQNTQTEPLVDETVPLGSAPESRAVPGRKKVSERDTQTDLTERMLLAILSSTSQIHTSSKSSAEGIFYDSSGYAIENQSQDQRGVAAAATSGRYDDIRSAASPSCIKESSEFRSGHKDSKGKMSMKTSLISERHDGDREPDVSFDSSPEGNMQFPDFLDGPGEYVAETGGSAREKIQPSDPGNGEGFLPDLFSPDDRLLSGMPDGAEGEPIGGKVGESNESQSAVLGQQQDTRKSSSKSKLRHKLETKKSTKPSPRGTGFVSELSTRGDSASLAGETLTGKITTGSEGEVEEESAKPSEGSEMSSLTIETDVALRLRRKRQPLAIIRYAEEEKVVGDWCTYFCRCCLPPYILFLLLLALACLLPLTEPDITCCFENHYPSTFGIKWTYPNGPPPV